MARYRQKPDLVEARQFTGGSKNAEELIKWLRSKGCEAEWIDNQTVLDIHLVERLQFISSNIIHSAYRTDWIVLRGNTWRIFSNRKFLERFETI